MGIDHQRRGIAAVPKRVIVEEGEEGLPDRRNVGDRVEIEHHHPRQSVGRARPVLEAFLEDRNGRGVKLLDHEVTLGVCRQREGKGVGRRGCDNILIAVVDGPGFRFTVREIGLAA